MRLARMLAVALVCGCAEEPPPVQADAGPDLVVVPEPTKPNPETIELPAQTSLSPDRSPDEESGYGRGSGAGFGGRGKRVPQVRHARALVEGALEVDQIRKVVREHINEVRGCYNETTSGTRASLQGRTAIEFEIGPDGRVRAAKVRESTVKDERFGDCVIAAIEGWRFPKPADGQPVTVVYPFNLSPG